MIIQLYKDFKKKKNSTALPSGAYDTYSCVLKKDCSLYNPIIQIEPASATTNLILYSYAYIPDMYRYYYVENITWVENSKWEISLSTDVLATNKTLIGESTQWVNRCSAQSNSTIIDNMYPTTCAITIDRHSWEVPFDTTGFFMVTGYQEDGEESSYIGTSTCVGMSKYQLKKLSTEMSSKISDVFDSENVSKMLVDPFQYIGNCMFFPIDLNSVGFSLKTGYKLHGVELSGVSYYTKTGTKFTYYKKGFLSITELPEHPDAEKYGSYLNGSAGTEITLFCPPFGAIPLNADVVRMGTRIRGDLTVDLLDGGARIDVYAEKATGDILLESISGQVGVNTKLEGTTIDLSGVVSGVGSIAGGFGTMLAGDPLKGATQAINGVASAYKSGTPQYSSIGSTSGGLASMYSTPFIQYVYHRKTGLDVENLGLPYGTTAKISELPGYIQCNNPHVNLSCSTAEREQVYNYMASGFYYE